MGDSAISHDPYRVLMEPLEPLRYIRNLCAHHSRVWNKWFLYRPKHTKSFGEIQSKPNTFHEQIIMLNHFNKAISPHSSWEEFVPFDLMGFSNPWNADPFWEL